MSSTDVYLSPHHDDVCFSLAMTAAAGKGGHLVNLYTRSGSVARGVPVPKDSAARIREVTRMRDEEDHRFATLTGLLRHDLELSDPPVRGIRPFDTQGIAADVAELRTPLLGMLSELHAAEPGRVLRLFCPMAIGGHRNHLAALLAVRENYSLIARFYRVLLYEDLPYASDPENRKSGIARALSLFQGQLGRRLVKSLPEAAFALKMNRAALYASQHSGMPAAASFIPATNVAQGPHEAFWRITSTTTAARSLPVIAQ